MHPMPDPIPRSPHPPTVAVDPVVEAYKAGIDRTLLRANLRKSVDERLDALAQLQQFADELRRAGRKARAQP